MLALWRSTPSNCLPQSCKWSCFPTGLLANTGIARDIARQLHAISAFLFKRKLLRAGTGYLACTISVYGQPIRKALTGSSKRVEYYFLFVLTNAHVISGSKIYCTCSKTTIILIVILYRQPQEVQKLIILITVMPILQLSTCSDKASKFITKHFKGISANPSIYEACMCTVKCSCRYSN